MSDHPTSRPVARRWMPLLGVAAAALGSSIVAAPAVAAVDPAHALTVGYNNGSNVLGETYPANSQFTVTVTRPNLAGGAPVQIATATGQTDAAGNLLVNSPEPAEPPAPAGACWTGTTPALLPGDTVSVANRRARTPDTTVVKGVTAGTPVADGAEVVLRGTASDATGAPLPRDEVTAQLFSAQPRFDVGNSGNQIRLADVFAYDAPGSTHWTARFVGLSARDTALALNTATPQVLWTDPAIGNEETLFESGATLGPKAPCTEPLARNAVTGLSAQGGSSASTVSGATVAAGSLNVSGLAQADATAVSVDVDDTNPATAPVTVPATVATGGTGSNTWTATVAGPQLAGLSDGALTARATYTVPGGVIAGEEASIAKDATAPAAPSASLAPGTYTGAQSATLSAEPGAQIRYTIDGTDPTSSSTPFSGPIAVDHSMQIRAIAIDAAGNAGPVAGFAYTVLAPPAPARPAARPAAGRPALAVRGLAAPRRISATQVRRAGLRLTMNVPRGTRVVRVRVFRATASGRRSGRALVDTRPVPRRAGRFVITLRDRVLRRPGRYRVEVTPGRSVRTLGRTSVKLVRVTR